MDPYTTGPQPQPRRRQGCRRAALIVGLVIAAFAAIVIVVAILSAIPSGHKTATRPAPATSSATPSSPAGTPTPATSGPTMLAVGQGAEVGQGDQTQATVTVKSTRVTRQPNDPSYGSAPANGYYVIVHISATADQSYNGGFDINSLDFYARTGSNHYSEGNGRAAEALSDSQASNDITATLAAGESSDGWLAFDVSAPHGQIVYAPNLDGQPVAEWKF